MRELTRANATQNIRVMKYLYMAILLDASPVAICTINRSRGNVSYLTQKAMCLTLPSRHCL
jgi:hypothetical protein